MSGIVIRGYYFEDLIGEGQYGKVFKSTHLGSGIDYAIKVIDKTILNNRDREQDYLFKSVPSTIMTSRARGENTTMMTSRITPLSSKLNWKSNRDD